MSLGYGGSRAGSFPCLAMSKISPNPYEPPAVVPAETRDGSDPYGWALLALVTGSGFVMALLPRDGQHAVRLVVILMAALLISADAKRWGFPPRTWLVVLLFLIGYLDHFHRRAERGAPKRFWLAVASMGFFVGAPMLRFVFAGEP